MAEFPYTQYDVGPSPAFPNGYSIQRPTLYVGIRKGERHCEVFPCVVDTGSDLCYFPADILSDLGINAASLPLASNLVGMGDQADIYCTTISLWVENLGEWDVYAGFSEYLRGSRSGLLGFRGFLDRFRVQFDPRAASMEIISL